MPKMLTDTLRDISENINLYIETREHNYIEVVSQHLKILFDANMVNFWYINMEDKTCRHLGEKEETIVLESSLLKQMIDSMKPLIENHVTSNKYYNQEIDNPLELKIRSLIMFPIIKGKDVIGVVKIWRSVQQRKVFNKNDEEKFDSLLPLYIKLFEGKIIEKSILLTVTKEKKTIKKNVTTSKSLISDKDLLVVELDKKYENLLREHQKYKEQDEIHRKSINSLEKTIEKLEIKQIAALQKEEEFLEYKKNYNSLIKEYSVLEEKNLALERNKNELELLKKKYKKIESVSIELSTEIKVQKDIIHKLEEKNKYLELDNKTFKETLQNKKSNNNSISRLKANELKRDTKYSFEYNFEFILQKLDLKIADNEFMFLLFELMIYGLSSKKGMSVIEENIKKSKLIPLLIENYYFQGDISIHNEKYLISDMVTHIKKYERDVFSETIKLKCTVDKKMPKSLVLDGPKVQSIILHLLFDLHGFINRDKNIDINFILEDKVFSIELGGYVHKKNSFFKSMFQQLKLGGGQKDYLGLHLSQKLIGRLKGNISYIYEDDYYKFVLILPTQLIKM